RISFGGSAIVGALFPSPGTLPGCTTKIFSPDGETTGSTWMIPPGGGSLPVGILSAAGPRPVSGLHPARRPAARHLPPFAIRNIVYLLVGLAGPVLRRSWLLSANSCMRYHVFAMNVREQVRVAGSPFRSSPIFPVSFPTKWGAQRTSPR